MLDTYFPLKDRNGAVTGRKVFCSVGDGPPLLDSVMLDTYFPLKDRNGAVTGRKVVFIFSRLHLWMALCSLNGRVLMGG
jgi:hypothetical protein